MYAQTQTAPLALDESLATLMSMLRWRRPAFTKTERLFVREFITPLGVRIDGYGNLIKVIGDNPTVLWSCHTDTVHQMGGKQLIVLDGDIIRLSSTENASNCLGADDTTGVWLMREMILAKRPGLYVFHRAEEVGCKGSTWIKNNTPELLTGIKAAIAFDRRGKDSVITHQSSGRTASNAFGDALSAILGNGYTRDDTGLFTDTDTYSGIVPECTNLSVGYEHAHSRKETQDARFALWLRDKMLALDINDLVIERDPAVSDYGDDYRGYDSWRGWNYDSLSSVSKATQTGYKAVPVGRDDYGPEGHSLSLLELCKTYPDLVADFLESEGFSTEALEDYFYSAFGHVPC